MNEKVRRPRAERSPDQGRSARRRSSAERNISRKNRNAVEQSRNAPSESRDTRNRASRRNESDSGRRKHSGGASASERQRRRAGAAAKRKQQVRKQIAVIAACLAVLVLAVTLLALRSSRRKGAAASADVSQTRTGQTALSSQDLTAADSGNISGNEAAVFSGPSSGAEEAALSVTSSEAENPADGARPENLPDIDVNSWEFILANPTHSISDYEPVVVDLEGIQVDYRIRDAMEAMVEATRDAGCSVYLSSGYRDYYTQKDLFESKAEEYGEEEAATIVARPGTSEHQTGLAADITDEYYAQKGRSLEETEMYQYMSAHCHEYGFIVRFPDGKEDITGIMYEPWHFRYVGVPAATCIMENGITLEEFLAYYGVE